MSASNRLPVLAAEIEAAHLGCTRSTAEVIRHALEAGRGLIEAKGLVPHGEWVTWLQANLPTISVRTCQRYMRAAENGEKRQRVVFEPARVLEAKPRHELTEAPWFVRLPAGYVASTWSAGRRYRRRPPLPGRRRLVPVGDRLPARHHDQQDRKLPPDRTPAFARSTHRLQRQVGRGGMGQCLQRRMAEASRRFRRLSGRLCSRSRPAAAGGTAHRRGHAAQGRGTRAGARDHRRTGVCLEARGMEAMLRLDKDPHRRTKRLPHGCGPARGADRRPGPGRDRHGISKGCVAAGGLRGGFGEPRPRGGQLSGRRRQMGRSVMSALT